MDQMSALSQFILFFSSLPCKLISFNFNTTIVRNAWEMDAQQQKIVENEVLNARAGFHTAVMSNYIFSALTFFLVTLSLNIAWRVNQPEWLRAKERKKSLRVSLFLCYFILNQPVSLLNHLFLPYLSSLSIHPPVSFLLSPPFPHTRHLPLSIFPL